MRIRIFPQLDTLILFFLLFMILCFVFASLACSPMVMDDSIYRTCLEKQLSMNYKFQVKKEDLVYSIHWPADLVALRSRT